MRSCQQQRQGYAWLEILLTLAVISLLIQLTPDAWVSRLDFRRWPRTAWFAVNLAVLALLISIRFGPDWIYQWRTRRAELTINRTTMQRQEEKKHQREVLEQMKAAQKRRIY